MLINQISKTFTLTGEKSFMRTLIIIVLVIFITGYITLMMQHF